MSGLLFAGGGGPVIPNFGHGTACLRNNHWFCTSWVRENWGDDPDRYREMGLEFPKE